MHLPPLRERLEDIALIAEYVLQTLQYPNAETALDQELLHELQSRPWFGNVRELRNAVEHAAVVARGRSLCSADFPSAQAGRLDSTAAQGSELERVIADWSRGALAKQAIEGGSLHEELMKAIEPTLLRIVLQETGGNRAKAAEMLGIHRGTLRDRLRGYGME